VARVLSTAFCVALLAATAFAFALTEGAKTELSPIYATKIDKVFSPTCNPNDDGCKQAALISFKLRKKQTLEVWVDHNGNQVASIISHRTYPKGKVSLSFDGTTDDGITILHDGIYQVVVRLVQEHRTITLPNLIEIDTVAPELTHFKKRIQKYISPDGDKHNDFFSEKYTLDGPGHGVLLVFDQQAVFTRSKSVHGVLTWNGTVDGKLQPPGKYTLYIAAQDVAGNRSTPFPFAVITIRYIQLGRKQYEARAGRRFAVAVHTDAPLVSWLFDRGRGTSHSHTLRIRAPRKPGTYHLYVTASGHTAGATVVVQ